MIGFLKKIWGYIASFGIALFAVLFGIERVRRKSAEKARDKAETKAEIAVTEKRATEKVAESIADISEQFQKVDEKEEEMRVNADEGEADYNSIADDWNNHRL